MSPREAQWDLPADPKTVGKGRDVVRDTLIAWGLTDLVSDVVVIVSELYTNAVRYGAAPITLRLRVAGRCLSGEITDHGAIFELPPHAAADDEHGRGLQIVAALSTGWGIDPHRVGKVVWFTKCR
ncbi:ATP-binding protein [Sphaerisporangium aureirubrum]|uniref:ATP-binding protein n=1 Tax=Sphaerisporangium aureirubrum TaxID=1544736 RepID=A0ABW1NY42_9ACTN